MDLTAIQAPFSIGADAVNRKCAFPFGFQFNGKAIAEQIRYIDGNAGHLCADSRPYAQIRVAAVIALASEQNNAKHNGNNHN